MLTDPLLAADYRPGPGSSYIDAGEPGCVGPNGSICDIGRFEASP